MSIFELVIRVRTINAKRIGVSIPNIWSEISIMT